MRAELMPAMEKLFPKAVEHLGKNGTFCPARGGKIRGYTGGSLMVFFSKRRFKSETVLILRFFLKKVLQRSVVRRDSIYLEAGN
jgi:hypothetical protein